MKTALRILQQEITDCGQCARLREYCTKVAQEKRAAYRAWDYWGKPVPNMVPKNGPSTVRLLLIGLAPAAHGANRTGRMFTGDRSGDFLFRAMYETGFANQPTSREAGDGLELIDAAITAVAHCAPPDNKPMPEEIAHCAGFLRRMIDVMPQIRDGSGGIMVLGRLAFDAALRLYRERGWLPAEVKPKPAFAHGALFQWPGAPFLLCTFHPSQQNTFTGRLTPKMMREVFLQARELLKLAPIITSDFPRMPRRDTVSGN